MRKSKALTAILRHSDQVLSTPDTDPAYPFLHTVVNYARAKQESEGALARVAELISIETQKPVNEAQIKPRFLSLVKDRFRIGDDLAEELFELIREDTE